MNCDVFSRFLKRLDLVQKNIFKEQEAFTLPAPYLHHIWIPPPVKSAQPAGKKY
jgi:hypothetical protein